MSDSLAYDFKIAQLTDQDMIYDLALRNLKAQFSDEMELMMKVWESRFRKEALEHYLKLGWSFVCYDKKNEDKIFGFLLAQPLLFIQAQTQSLWVELVVGINSKIEKELLEIAYKLARDKHLQRVIYSQTSSERVEEFNKNVNCNDGLIWLRTTK